jgi:hypothetical protein
MHRVERLYRPRPFILAQYAAEHRCSGCCFSGEMSSPRKAGPGVIAAGARTGRVPAGHRRRAHLPGPVSHPGLRRRLHPRPGRAARAHPRGRAARAAHPAEHGGIGGLRRHQRAVRVRARHCAACFGPGADGAPGPERQPFTDAPGPQPAQRESQRPLTTWRWSRRRGRHRLSSSTDTTWPGRGRYPYRQRIRCAPHRT